jgi:hypothetical protein
MTPQSQPLRGQGETIGKSRVSIPRVVVALGPPAVAQLRLDQPAPGEADGQRALHLDPGVPLHRVGGEPHVAGEHRHLVAPLDPALHHVPAGQLVAPVVVRGIEVGEGEDAHQPAAPAGGAGAAGAGAPPRLGPGGVAGLHHVDVRFEATPPPASRRTP